VFCFEDFISDVCQGSGTPFSLFLSFIFLIPYAFHFPQFLQLFFLFLEYTFSLCVSCNFLPPPRPPQFRRIKVCFFWWKR
jgi:hypothetical protein